MTAIATPDSLNAVLARSAVAHILSILNAEGEQARLIGGAVRNSLMGLPVADIDIATTALPQTVILRAETAGLPTVPTGIDHGTVTVLVGGVPHEVTTLREDIATDGRRAVVRYGRDFRADALRRDFTVNALSVDATGTIHDYAGGLDDLAARRIRFIGDPDQRIREDYLRVLRFFRFAAAYGKGYLDPEGLAAAIRNRAGLRHLSRERIRAEILKLMIAADAGPVIAEMAHSNVLAETFAGPCDVAHFRAMIGLERTHDFEPDVVRRLMALAIRDQADIIRLREALRLTKKESLRIEAILASLPELLRFSIEPPQPAELAAKVLLYRLGAENYRDALMVYAAQSGEDITSALALPARWNAPKFLLTGKDVIARGIPKGPEVSHLLTKTEHIWLQNGLPADENQQRQLLAEVVTRR